MPRSFPAPRVKGPYPVRGGTRFRIRICDGSAHRDLSFATLEEALKAKSLAEKAVASPSKLDEVGGSHGVP